MRPGIRGRWRRWCWRRTRITGATRRPPAGARPAWPSGGSSSSDMAEPTGAGALFSEPAVLVPVGAWEVAHASGNDRIAFLHRLLTGKIEGLAPGQGARALLLTVKGHIVADLRVAVAPDRVHLVMPPGQGESTVAALSRYAVMDDFALALDPTARMLAAHGPASEDVLRAAGVEVPSNMLSQPRYS